MRDFTSTFIIINVFNKANDSHHRNYQLSAMSFFVREHFNLRGDAPLKNKIDAESGFAWQRSHRTQDGVLKPLLSRCRGQLQLTGIKLAVKPLLAHQLLMIAHFRYAALIQDDDLIRISNCAESMRNHQSGASL